MQKMQSEEDAKWLHQEEENLVCVASVFSNWITGSTLLCFAVIHHGSVYTVVRVMQ